MYQASLRRATRRAASVAVAALLAGLLPAQQVGATPASVSFFVVGPDGLPVVEPYVMSWVLGGSQVVVHQSRGSADGQVTVAVPDDPVAAARMAEDLPVNMMSLVMDREPGTPGLAAVPVASAINATGIPTLPVDVAATGGKVYTLVPDLVDFVDGPSQWPDEPECQPPPLCHLVDWPAWARENFVPVADNYGGGHDVVATMTYQSTDRTTTSVAFSTGASGFVEARGGVSYVTTNTLSLGWPPTGPNVTEQALLQTTFQRTRSGLCWVDRDYDRHCALSTTYQPYQAVGTYSRPAGGLHDTLNVALDCKTQLEGFFFHGKGTSTGQWFGFTLGPSEEWATTFVEQGHGLHAQTTVTAETSSGKGFQRRWKRVDNPTYEHHWMMVKGGLAAYDRLQEGGGGTCPETAVQDAYTHATNVNLVDAKETAVDTAQDAANYELCDPVLTSSDPAASGAGTTYYDTPAVTSNLLEPCA